VDAETGQRGHLVTVDDKNLAPYQSTLAANPGTLNDVRKLTADNPDQQRRLNAFAPLIDAKLAELKQTIDLRRNQGLDAATKVVVGGSVLQLSVGPCKRCAQALLGSESTRQVQRWVPRKSVPGAASRRAG
jgi:CHASE3 domain